MKVSGEAASGRVGGWVPVAVDFLFFYIFLEEKEGGGMSRRANF